MKNHKAVVQAQSSSTCSRCVCILLQTPLKGAKVLRGFGSFPPLPPQPTSLDSLYQAKAALTPHRDKSFVFSSSLHGHSASLLILSKQETLPDSLPIPWEMESACHFFCK